VTDEAISYNTSISEIDMKTMEFFRLTREALDSNNDDAFFNVLIERNKMFGSIKQFPSSLSPEYIKKMIFIEKKIAARLENERKKIIEDIDKISQQINTLKAYSVRFPIPSMPAFFDQTG
jgi:hypothetical protein